MKTFTFHVVLVALLGFATLACAEIIQWEPCSEQSVDCTVHEVQVIPCREAARGKPCRIKKGRTASIISRFTPNFPGDLTTRAYWKSEVMDLPFVGMDNNACSYTTCPAVPGTEQTYNYTLSIDRNFNARVYDVKWKLWNAEEKECCFIFQIKLVG